MGIESLYNRIRELEEQQALLRQAHDAADDHDDLQALAEERELQESFAALQRMNEAPIIHPSQHKTRDAQYEEALARATTPEEVVAVAAQFGRVAHFE
jgi:hypothetical protein